MGAKTKGRASQTAEMESFLGGTRVSRVRNADQRTVSRFCMTNWQACVLHLFSESILVVYAPNSGKENRFSEVTMDREKVAKKGHRTIDFVDIV